MFYVNEFFKEIGIRYTYLSFSFSPFLSPARNLDFKLRKRENGAGITARGNYRLAGATAANLHFPLVLLIVSFFFAGPKIDASEKRASLVFDHCKCRIYEGCLVERTELVSSNEGRAAGKCRNGSSIFLSSFFAGSLSLSFSLLSLHKFL